MTIIKIITAKPGQDTKAQIVAIVEKRATGITIKELSQQLNRPISMLQICLRQLVYSKQIVARQSKVSKTLIYYPKIEREA